MLVYGHDKELCTWASLNLFGIPNAFDDKSVAIGVKRDGKIIACFVYNNYIEDIKGRPHSIELSVFSVDSRWMNRHTIKAMFSYPFTQLGLRRLQILTSINNEGVNSIVKRLGFIKEGEHKLAYADCSDAFSWRMLAHECKWIKS